MSLMHEVFAPQALSEALRNLALLRERLAPDRMFWGVFPGDGFGQPMPAGLSRIDVRGGRVETPNGVLQMAISPEIRLNANSFIVVVDQLVAMEVLPGPGPFVAGPAILEVGWRSIDLLNIRADAPYWLQLFISTGAFVANADLRGFWATRISDATLTKVAAAGTADPLGDDQGLSFLSKDGLKTSVTGVPFLITSGYGQKVFWVRNLGANDVDVQAMGSIFPDVSSVLGFIPDTDVDPLGNPITVPAGTVKTLETALPWQTLQLRARMSAGVAAGLSSRVVTEYVSQIGVVR